MVRVCNEPYTSNVYDEHFQKYPFELSDFQKYSIEAIVEGHHSLVTAHTGSGKTLPAEFAIQYFTKLGKKIVYTSPIKALSNQKFYEFTNKYPDISFGLFTGDIKTNPCADVLIMTTEILMNYLFSLDNEYEENDQEFDFQLNIKEELACVIFDEVHYINDQHRGQNWEQTILMLPKHIQMIMLSATIDSPEKFAKWCERGDENGKQVYLSGTHKRVVPLTHYGFLTTNESVFKKIRDKETQQNIRCSTNKFIILKDSNDSFNDQGYLDIKKNIKLFQQNLLFINKTHVLNQLVFQLKEKDMLPAIVFVFSRRNVEFYANSITTNILEFDSKIPYTIKQECDQIIRKLPNFSEYMNLPEYNDLIKLLEKGIGIHHSGMIPILREIVEYMISRKHIKLLFATESFAIGLDCPIRTAVFASLTKFDGNKSRYLLPHEYSQAAGRAGRRGLDTVGHVIHCNNIFDFPMESEYKEILCGKSQQLISKFNMSFSVILNLIKNGKTKKQDFIDFTEKSMLKQEVDKAVEIEEKTFKNLELEIKNKEECVSNIRTPRDVCDRYIALMNINSSSDIAIKRSGKQQKNVSRELENIRSNYKFLMMDVGHIEKLNQLKDDYSKLNNYIQNCKSHISSGINRMCDLLIERGFIIYLENEEYQFLQKGENASNVAEVHSLIMSEVLADSNYFEFFSPSEIVGILSIFTDIKVSDDFRSSIPQTKNKIVKQIVNDIMQKYEYYCDLEESYGVLSGENYNDTLNLDLIDPMQEWCDLNTEQECKYFIQTQLTNDLAVSLGDFIKGLLKINALSKELMKICDKNSKATSMYKLSQIEGLILKFIATTQSLYL